MKQISSAQAEHQNKKKVARRELFLAQMDALMPWQRLIEALSLTMAEHLAREDDKRIYGNSEYLGMAK